MTMQDRTVRWVGYGLLALCATTFQAQAVNKVHLTNGKTLAVTSIQWRESEQSYRVESEGAVIPIPKGQVDYLEIDKPADFDKASQMLAAKQYAAAVPILEDIVAKFKMLTWDNEARVLLGQIHLAMNDPKKAADVLSSYMNTMKKSDVPADVFMLYWKALMGAGRSASLKKELDEVVAAGNREMVAAAMLMRGNMNREAGQKELAVLDYLRVVILFENVRSLQAEALFRAAEILEELRDPRADELKKRLVQEYKDSEYAARLSGKI